jgi:histidinol dehydrogenase
MAYGTESVPKVHKIFGPGNSFVAAAKSYVASSGVCAIDFLAGPSEILVIADNSAIKEVEWIARDMVSQAEHDPDACAILVTTSKEVAVGVRSLIKENRDAKGEPLGVSNTARLSLSKYGAIVLVNDLYQAVEFSNDFAPEHLEIMTESPRNWLKSVRNAGSIFLGKWSPVAYGDYICPNHILPTGGAARYTSGINIDMFMKKPSVSNAPWELATTFDRLVKTLSEAEKLYNQHGLSVKARADAVRSRRRR